MRRLFKISTTILILSIFSSCKYDSTEGIEIRNTLYVHQDYSENSMLIKLIERTLKQDPKALSELISFPCGGGAGCYDLGFVITQIIYKMGEHDFIKLAEQIDEKKHPELLSRIGAGLAYGDQDKNGKVNNMIIEKEFPKINELIKE